MHSPAIVSVQATEVLTCQLSYEPCWSWCIMTIKHKQHVSVQAVHKHVYFCACTLLFAANTVNALGKP